MLLDLNLVLFLICHLIAIFLTQSYAGIIRYTSIEDGLRISYTTFIGSVLIAIVSYLNYWYTGSVIIPLSVLIILDGLNQNWSKQDWSDFLQPVLDDTYRGRFRVLMTCWPDWWSSIGELKNLEPKTKSSCKLNCGCSANGNNPVSVRSNNP